MQGLAEDRAPFGDEQVRERVEYLASRIIRDRVFRPVAENGPDIVTNGIALSGTVHWMFDRGLIGLSDNREILLSRQLNDPDGMRALINKTEHALPPKHPTEYPHPAYLRWHREYCFKH